MNHPTMARPHRHEAKKERVDVSGDGLTIRNAVQVARHGVQVFLSEEPRVRRRILASQKVLQEKLECGEVIYGVNTGFGGNVRFILPRRDLARHQENLLRFMVCGSGSLLPEDAVRASMLLRANALAKGFSGVRPAVIDHLLALLNEGITPLVPRYGSVGASGDLIPSAYVGRALLGQGEVWHRDGRKPAAEALRQVGLQPLRLEPKEGLALINGTTVMTGIGALVLHDGSHLAALVLGCAALTMEALLGTDDPFHEVIQRVKHHPGQVQAAALCRRLLEGSRYVRPLDDVRRRIATQRSGTKLGTIRSEEAIQNPYSLRCVPQGLGPVIDALAAHRQVIEREMNSVNDNPLIDPDQGRIYHTGNFYGGHVALALDSWKISLATLGNWLHALMAMLVDDRFNNGLPPNLAPKPGLSSGFKGFQLGLTSLVCEMRHLSNPATIHTLATEQYNQDVVSLGTHAALGALDMTEMLRDAAAMVLITLCQAIDLRGGSLDLGRGTREIYESVRSRVGFMEEDRSLEEDMAKVKDLIQKNAFHFVQEKSREYL